MTTITEIKLWKDVWIMENDIYVPTADSNLQDPDFELDYPVCPPTGDMFSKITVPEEYQDLMDCSYMSYKVVWNNGEPQHFYCWIDSVELRSDSDGKPVTVINHHVDLWRTYYPSVTLGYGHVRNRHLLPKGDESNLFPYPKNAEPMSPASSAYRVITDRVNLVPDTIRGMKHYWAVINYNYEYASTDGGPNDTVIMRTMVLPFSENHNEAVYMRLSSDSDIVRAPSLEDFVTGSFDEKLKIVPSAISSAFISLVPPLDIDSGDGSYDNPYQFIGQGTSPTPVTENYDIEPGTMPFATSYTLSATRFALHLDNGTNVDQGHSTNIEGVWGSLAFDVNEYTEFKVSAVYGGTTHNATPTRPVVALPVDAIARKMLGDTVYNKLVNGDTITFDRGSLYEGCSPYSNYYLDGAYNAHYEYRWTATGNMMTECVYQDGSFQGYLFYDDYPSQIKATLTTYSKEILKSEYAVVVSNTIENIDYGYAYTKNNRFAVYEAQLTWPLFTDNQVCWTFTDLDGTPLGNYPWGQNLASKDYTIRLVVTESSAYVQFRFHGTDSSLLGTAFSAPLPTIGVSSNSWSDYVASGEREYSVESRRLANEQALYQGIASSITGGASSAVMGSLNQRRNTVTNEVTRVEQFGPRGGRRGSTVTTVNRGVSTGSPLGAGAMGTAGAFALTAGVGIGTAVAQYGLDSMYAEKMQRSEDLFQSRQIDNLLISSNGYDWLYNGRQYQMVKTRPDEYSNMKFMNTMYNLGMEVSEPWDYLGELPAGPWRITELQVLGDVPVEAKQYIKLRFEKGLILSDIIMRDEEDGQ